jgi:hypothetical protein
MGSHSCGVSKAIAEPHISVILITYFFTISGVDKENNAQMMWMAYKLGFPAL